jgi:hypothetical protein
MEPMKDHPTSRACPAPKIACASRTFRGGAGAPGAIRSTTPPTSASPSSCGPSISPILHGKLFDLLSRLIERGQVVSAVTLKTYVEQDEDMKARAAPPTRRGWRQRRST